VSVTPRARFYRFFKDLLSRPGVERWIIGVSLFLMSACLNTGLAADDLLHAMMARGSHAIEGFARHPLDLFRFTDARNTELLMRDGILSWWTDPNAQLSFFRPVASFTHYLDQLLWPDNGWLMHLHSMLWGLMVFLGVLALYRRLIPLRWVAMLALYLYVLDDARAWFGSWVAARNAVTATAFSVWALVYYHRQHTEGFRAGAWLGPLFLVLGLLSGEGAVSTCGYLFAHALYLQKGPLAPRLLTLTPYAVCVVAWRGMYRALGYGVSGSGLYVDPVNDPLRFLGALAEHGPVLMFAQLGGPWSDVWTALFVWPWLGKLIIVSGLGMIGLLGYALVPLWKVDPLVRFGTLGSVLSVLPAVATFPADRLLTWVAIGACIVLARLLAGYIEHDPVLEPTPRRRGLMHAVAFHVMLSSLWVAPPVLASRARGNMALRDVLGRCDAGVPQDAAVARRTLVFINPPAVPLFAYIPIMRAAEGRPWGRLAHMLASGTTELEIERPDAHTLRIAPRGGFLLNPASQLLRVPDRGFHAGQTIKLSELVVTVTRLTPDGRPAEILARFERALDDPSFEWLQWSVTTYGPWQPPAVGETVHLAGVDYVPVMFGDQVEAPFAARMEP
jgi:hypothetical protein